MPRGPLPSKRSRRRNSPTIPTTELPVTGRKGRPPKVPAGYELGDAGAAWWKWAWSTPQAAAWDVGAHYAIARRAQLEDEVAALEEADGWLERVDNSLIRILETEDPLDLGERLRYLGELLAKLKSLSGGRVTFLKEMRELDKVLGLTPKDLAALRWTIVSDEQYEANRKAEKADAAGTAAPAPAAPKKKGKPKLRVVDAELAASASTG